MQDFPNDFLTTSEIQLLEGRDFLGEAGAPYIPINEMARKAMRLEKDPIGQRIVFWQGEGKFLDQTFAYRIEIG